MDIYINLPYKLYKELERQMKAFDELETTHLTVDNYHHKAIRLKLGEVEMEFHGPIVKKPKP